MSHVAHFAGWEAPFHDVVEWGVTYTDLAGLTHDRTGIGSQVDAVREAGWIKASDKVIGTSVKVYFRMSKIGKWKEIPIDQEGGS